MRLQEQLRLAWLNCLARRSITLQIILGLSITLYLFLTVMGYISALKKLLQDTAMRYYASNCVTISGPAHILSETQAAVMQQYPIQEIVRYTLPYMEESWIDAALQKGIMPALQDSVLFIEDQGYPFRNHTGLLYEIGDVIDLRCYEGADAMLTQHELQEYTQRTEKSSPLMLGRLPQNTGELLLPACYAEAYDLQPEQLVGKRISLMLSGMKGEERLFRDAVVSGILYNDFFSISNRNNCCIMQLGTISADHNTVIRLYPESYADLRDIANIFEVLDAAEVQIPTAFIQYEYLEKQYGFAKQVMLPTVWMILAAMLLNIQRIVIYSFSKQMGYRGMLQAMGLRLHTLLRIHMLELAMQTLCALLPAFVGYLLTERWLVNGLIRMIHAEGGLPKVAAALPILGCASLILVFWSISALLLGAALRKQNVIALLRHQS